MGRGSSLEVEIEASDGEGLDQLVLNWSGAFTGSKTRELSGKDQHSETITISVPTRADYGDLLVQAVATSVSGRSDTSSSVAVVIDEFPPEACLDLLGLPEYDIVLHPGDRLRFSVTASDNDELAWVGWALFPDGSSDSVSVSSAYHSETFEVQISEDWIGQQDLIAWAQDSFGNHMIGCAAVMWFLDSVERPISSVSTPGVTDMAYDLRSNLLFLSFPEPRQVGVVSLDSFQLIAQIGMPFEPDGVALTPSGDSLFVTFPESDYTGVIDLKASEWQPSLERLDIPLDALGHRPTDVRITTDNKMFVLLGPGHVARILEYDLNTKQQRIRSDAGHAGLLRDGSRMEMSHDGGTIVLLSPMPEVQIYTAETDTFAAPVVVEHNDPDPVLSVDATGSRFLLGNALFDEQLRYVRSFTPLGYWGGEDTQIGPDGDVVYFAAEYGYSVVRASDAAVLERVEAPFGIIPLVIPELDLLIIDQGWEMWFVDLAATPAQPASRSQGRR